MQLKKGLFLRSSRVKDGSKKKVSLSRIKFPLFYPLDFFGNGYIEKSPIYFLENNISEISRMQIPHSVFYSQSFQLKISQSGGCSIENSRISFQLLGEGISLAFFFNSLSCDLTMYFKRTNVLFARFSNDIFWLFCRTRKTTFD